jgi:MFS family permease
MFVYMLCIVEILSMAGTMYFPALLPSFQSQWGISNTEAGWINGIFFAGYALSSPILVGLTDRIDPRRIYIPSALLGAVSMILFGLLATGTWSAAVIRLLAGVSLAGTYMPGLKALSDQLTGPRQSRHIVFYTASYGFGMALSVFWTGLLDKAVGWQAGAVIVALGPLAAMLMFAFVVPKREPAVQRAYPRLCPSDLAAIFRNKRLMGYIVGYSAHCWELFGFRSWLVAFLSFSLAFHPHIHSPLNPQNMAMVVLLSGALASVLGNEGAMRGKRLRAVSLYMLGSGLLGCLIGFLAALQPIIVMTLVFIYGITVMSDSGALTAGIIAESDEKKRGMTLAVYSFLGFFMAFLAPLCFGIILDAAGGIWGWGMAFAALGIGCMLGPLAFRILR